jgi:hemoglobin
MEKPYGFQDTSFRAAGGEEGLRRLVRRFYEFMDSQPEARKIREMHKEDLEDVRERLTLFLCGWLGGPRLYQEKHGPIAIPMFHLAFPIGPAERNAWLRCMQLAVDEQPYEPSFKKYLMEQLAVPAERCRNRE